MINREIHMRWIRLSVLLIIVLVVGGVLGAKVYPRMRAIPQGDASIWLNRPLIKAQVDALEAEIAAWPEVERVVYISETERVERLYAVAGMALMEGVNGNPFNPSFVLTLRSPLQAQEIMARLQTNHSGLVGQVDSKL